MPDRGAKYADKKISEIDRKLRQTYKQAQTELTRKLKDFNKRFETQDKQKRKEVSEGKITQQQYKDWLQRQVFTRSIWQQKIDQVSQVMLHHNEYAAQIVNESRFDVFAENYYAEAFRANWIIQGIDWTVYNTQALQRLIENEPQILPEWKIDEEKDYKWNEKKVNNIVQQGIIQGESVDQITQRLCTDLSTQNENRMRLFARTAITGAQNAGRQEQMREAVAMGLDVNKRWIATLDSRTRDSHRAIDGEEVPQDEDFSNGLEYPGDPSGDPAEVYNCRCTMQSVYPKYEDRSKKWREGVEIDGQSYEEWKEGKKNDQGTQQPSELEQKIAGVVKGKPMTHEEADTGRVNPNFLKGVGYRINCQSCVVAYEARRRGYDVEVVSNDKQHPVCGQLARNTRLAWKDRTTGKTPDFMFQYKPTLSSKWVGEPPTPIRFKKLLMENIQENARYHLGFGWKGSSRSGHIVTLGKEKGQLFIYDPQSDTRYTGAQFDKYLTRLKMQRTSYGYKYYQYPEVLRVDDKDFDYDIVNQVVKGVEP